MNDRAEAHRELGSVLRPFRDLPYMELVRRFVNIEPITGTVTGSSGQQYEYEVEGFWDDGAGGTVRVLASIFDGSLRRTFLPLSDSFLKNPDGSFAGE